MKFDVWYDIIACKVCCMVLHYCMQSMMYGTYLYIIACNCKLLYYCLQSVQNILFDDSMYLYVLHAKYDVWYILLHYCM